MKRARERRRVAVVLSCFALVILAVMLVLWLDLFGPRYEGKTVRQWVAICVEDPSKLDDRLVMGFGSSATPELLGIVRRFHSKYRAVDKLGSDELSSFVLRKLTNSKKLFVAVEWLALLHFLGEPVLEPLCELQDNSTVMLILSHVDEVTLNEYREQTTNTFLRRRANNEDSVRRSSGVLRRPSVFQNFGEAVKRIKERRASMGKEL